MSRISIRLFFFLLVFFHFYSLAVVIGSETAVSVQPMATFPAADNDNTMLGFGWFKNGFTLEDSSTTCTFNCVYPVSGAIVFNGGTLYLSEDLHLSNTCSVHGGGTIVANDHTVELCSSVTSLLATYTLRDSTFVLACDITLTGSLVFEGDCYIEGHMHHIILEDGGALIAADGATLIIDDVFMEGIEGTNIACATDDSKIILHDIDWFQSDDFTFEKGSIEFSHHVDFYGSSTFHYDSSQTSTIASGSTWLVTGDMTLKIGRKEAVDYVEPIYFVDETSILKLDNASLTITGSGINLTKGKFELDRDVIVDVLSSSTSNGLIIGTGQSVSDDFCMKLNSGASIGLRSGWWVYNNIASSGRLQALSETSRCLRYPGSKFYVMRDWTIPMMVFKIVSSMPESVLADGVTFRYDNTKLITPMAELDMTGGDLAPGFALAGNDGLYMSKGSLAMPIYVSGTGNELHGTGDITGPITMQDDGSDLCCQLNGVIDQSIVMNGGDLSIMSDLVLGPDVVLSGSGTVNLTNYRCLFGCCDHTWTSTIAWEGSGGMLNLDSQVSLNGTWTFKGMCILNGNEQLLDFGESGRIVVDSGATLRLKHISLTGISGEKIRCLGDDSLIILDDVNWTQSGDFNFTTGALQWRHDVKMAGSSVFAYQSDQTSTIAAGTGLTLDEGFTFSYDPNSMAKDLIAFADETAQLTMNGATLHATVTGMQLTNGHVRVGRDSYLVSETQLVPDGEGGTTEIDEGITFGNGVASGDFTIEVANGVVLKMTQGSLNYRNVYSSSLLLCSVASYLYMDFETNLRLYESMVLGNGMLFLGDRVTIGRASGKDITGSISPLGVLFYESL